MEEDILFNIVDSSEIKTSNKVAKKRLTKEEYKSLKKTKKNSFIQNNSNNSYYNNETKEKIEKSDKKEKSNFLTHEVNKDEIEHNKSFLNKKRDNNFQKSHKFNKENNDNSNFNQDSHSLNKNKNEENKYSKEKKFEKTKNFNNRSNSKDVRINHSYNNKIDLIEKEKENVIDIINVEQSDDRIAYSAKSFEDLNLNKHLTKELSKHNYLQLTKIQKQAIPIMIEHKNVVVKSETGTGKTLAYLVPLYEQLLKLNEITPISRKDGIYCIIFAPTHELCLQIETTINKISNCCIRIISGTLIGGQKIDVEKVKLRKGVNIIVCTPGRLLYHLKNTKSMNFNKLQTLIFDEADVLLDMGFEKDVKECLKMIVEKNNIEFKDIESFKKYKIHLISATIDNKIRTLIQFLMKGFKSVGFKQEKKENKQLGDKKDENNLDLDKEKMDDNEDIQTIPSNIKQYYSLVYDEFRLIHLICFLYLMKNKKIIIFINNCESVDFHLDLFSKIKLNGYKLFPNEEFELLKLHGKIKHEERVEVFKKYNKIKHTDKSSILFATDVIARGLDFPNVDWIVHYDVNPNYKDYINRTGRTARLTSSGNSLIFLMKHEENLLTTCFKSFSLDLYESHHMLLNFQSNFNKSAEKDKQLSTSPMNWEAEIDINEIYRKKYSFVVHPLIFEIKEYLYTSDDKKNKNDDIEDEIKTKVNYNSVINKITKNDKDDEKKRTENFYRPMKSETVNFAKRAYKCTLRAYTTNRKYAPDIFNLNALHLTRFARAFGLYKESLKYKFENEQYRVDQKEESNKTKSQKKIVKSFKKMEISEFM